MDLAKRLFVFCLFALFCYMKANPTVEYFSQPVKYRELSKRCDDEGGLPIMSKETSFGQLIANRSIQSIPFNQEFWVADYLYTFWILPIDCVKKSAVEDPGQNVKVTAELSECYSHCRNYPFFAMKIDFCVCLDSYNPSTVADSECSVECGDVGLCGGQDGAGQQFVNIYAIEPDAVPPSLNIQLPSGMGAAYIECLTARCLYSDYRAQHCVTQNNFGLCGTGTVTSVQTSYTKSMANCWGSSGLYFKDSCANVSNSVMWIGPMRFVTPSRDGAIFGYPVAKGAKCTKFTDGTVTCISTNEETNLPFVCKMVPDTTDPNPNTTPDSKGDNNKNNAGVIVGFVIGVLVVIVAIAVSLFYHRKKNNKFENKASERRRIQEESQPKSVYEIPKPRENEHEYADTKDIYHQYIEIKDSGSTSYGQNGASGSTSYGQNGTSGSTTYGQTGGSGSTSHGQNGNPQSDGFNNDSFLKVPSTIPLNSNDINISMLGVDNEGYLDPKKSPNFGRKLPELPSERL